MAQSQGAPAGRKVECARRVEVDRPGGDHYGRGYECPNPQTDSQRADGLDPAKNWRAGIQESIAEGTIFELDFVTISSNPPTATAMKRTRVGAGRNLKKVREQVVDRFRAEPPAR